MMIIIHNLGRRSIPVSSAAGGKLFAIEHPSSEDYLDDFVIGLPAT
jgi:hypothetical protein